MPQLSIPIDISTSIKWLLTNGSAPVRYLTQKYIASDNPSSQKMLHLWAEVEKFADTKEIFSKQAKNGSWNAAGSWAAKQNYVPKTGYSPYSPKYVTTIWVLALLGDMGFDITNERVHRACEFTMKFQAKDGTFGNFARSYFKNTTCAEPPNIPCHLTGYLMGLAKVGMGTDFRLDKSYDLLVKWQRDDGGWLNQRHITGQAAPYIVWTRSCPWVTYFACQALQHCGRQEYKESYIKGLNFLAEHLSSKPSEVIKRFYYHGHEILKELLMFSEMNIKVSAKTMSTLSNWLMQMYNAETGQFHYDGKPLSKMSRAADGHTPKELKYRLYHVIESDWLTYYVTRIAANLKNT